MRRETVMSFGATLPTCIIAMEACCGAHHMGRALAAQGHTIRLMSPEYVRPYVKAQKNDDRDAEAIAEAATRPTMRFVALKSEAQLDMQTLHRVRDQLVGERTALMNQIRAVLLERGHIVPQGRAKLAASLENLLDTEAVSDLTPRMRSLVADVRERWQSLDVRIAALDAEFTEQARKDESTRRLTTIPGIGALNASQPALCLLIHRRPRRQVVRHEPPRGPRLHDEPQAVEHLPQVVVTLARTLPQQRQIRRNQRPFLIGHVRWIGAAIQALQPTTPHEPSGS